MILNLKPARVKARANDEIDVIADLDSLSTVAVGFTFMKQTFVIQPITTDQLFKLVKSFEALDNLKKKKGADEKDWKQAYWKVFKTACPEITLDMVGRMTNAQIGALFQLVLDVLTGRVSPDQEKKKITQPPPPSA